MEPRRYTFSDTIIGEISRAINVLAAPAAASRPLRGEPDRGVLSEADRLHSSRLMRVNHAGEIAAQALYRGQAFFARDAKIAAALHKAAAEEVDHLGWCAQRLTELHSRPSIFNPLWYLGSFAIGSLAALLGDESSLSFMGETETQVESHLSDHLQRLPPDDQRSRDIVESMRQDEARHGREAMSLGGKPLPQPLRFCMRIAARTMIATSFWL